jgi:hypothetical protein
MDTTPHSPPCKFPTSGFVELDATEKIEEEDVPAYVPEDYYPVYIGEVFRSSCDKIRIWGELHGLAVQRSQARI